MSIPEITPAELLQRRAAGEALTLLDVREGWELQVSAVPADQQVLHIPMGEVPARLGELSPDQPVAVLCRSGRRSLEVARLLQQSGFDAVNVTGGILAWSQDVDATIPMY